MPRSDHPNSALHLQPVETDTELPAVADTVVIGGGIIGVTAAWHLARRGMRVVVCEKGVIGGEQSGRNWGWCRQTLRDPREVPLMKISMIDWCDTQVFGALKTGFRTTGIMYLTGRVSGDAQTYAAWLESVRDHALDSHMLDASEVTTLLPDCRERPPGGALYTPSDGCAEPGWAAPAIAVDARRHGVGIHTMCAVRSLETQDGRLAAVITEKGRIRCNRAILAGGAWSRLFAGNLGLNLPALNVRGSVMFTPPMPDGPDISVVGRNFGWRKRADGGYILSQADATLFDIVPDGLRLFTAFAPLLKKSVAQLRMRIGQRFFHELVRPRRWNDDAPSPFEHDRFADPEPSRAVLDQARARVGEAMPFFGAADIAGRWGGYIDVTPDMLPLIGPSADIDGLVYATGFSGHGFGLGPGGGRLAAEIAANDRPCVDMNPYRPARFGL